MIFVIDTLNVLDIALNRHIASIAATEQKQVYRCVGGVHI